MIEIKKILYYLLLGTTLLGSAQAADDHKEYSSHSSPKMTQMEQIREAKKLGLSLREYQQLLYAQVAFDTASKEENSHPHTPAPQIHISHIPQRQEFGSIDSVLANAIELVNHHRDSWDDQALITGRNIFKKLTLKQLKKPEVLGMVLELGSEALYNVYMEAKADLAASAALRQMAKYQRENYPDKELGVDFFFTVGQDGIYTDSILSRKNSSGQNNDCLLFSIIRDNGELLTKVLGDDMKAALILSCPEKADNDEGERRDLSEVRKKFFSDIIAHLDVAYKLVNGKTQTLRQFLDHVIVDTNRRYARAFKGKKITSAEQLLATLDYNHLMLDHDFSVIFSLLYDVPIQVLVPSRIDPYQLIPQTPNLFIMPKGEMTFVYHPGQFGNHFQKLIVEQRRKS